MPLKNKNNIDLVSPQQPGDDIPSVLKLSQIYQRRRTRTYLLFGQFCLDILFIAGSFAASGLIYHYSGLMGQSGGNPSQILPMIGIVIPLYILFGIYNKTFVLSKSLVQLNQSLPHAFEAFLASVVGFFVMLFFTKTGGNFSRVLIFAGTLTSLVALVFSRMFIIAIAEKVSGGRLFATLYLHDFPVAPRDQDGAMTAGELGIKPDLTNADSIKRLGLITHDLDNLVVSCPVERRAVWAAALRTIDIQSELVMPELNALAPIGLSQRDDATAVRLILSTGQLSLQQRIFKRAFDLTVASVGILLLLPVFVFFAIAVKLESKGPIFFKQERIGLNNRAFRIFKFRSMRQSDDTRVTLTLREDPRVTRIGAFIRKTSIDELPQLFNVLLGDMSIVGPRPHAEGALAGGSLYWEVDTAYWNRHVVKPGLTGLAQVRGFRGNTFEHEHLSRRLEADLEYVSEWSLIKDIQIVVLTFTVLFHRNAF